MYNFKFDIFFYFFLLLFEQNIAINKHGFINYSNGFIVMRYIKRQKIENANYIILIDFLLHIIGLLMRIKTLTSLMFAIIVRKIYKF